VFESEQELLDHVCETDISQKKVHEKKKKIERNGIK
jgi:hypothetical protein